MVQSVASGGADPAGTIELGRRKAWEDVKAILSRFERVEFSTRCILADGTTFDFRYALFSVSGSFSLSAELCDDCRCKGPAFLDLAYGFLSQGGSFSPLIVTLLRHASRVVVAIAKIYTWIVVKIGSVTQ